MIRRRRAEVTNAGDPEVDTAVAAGVHAGGAKQSAGTLRRAGKAEVGSTQ
jgi:hypothetical protein